MRAQYYTFEEIWDLDGGMFTIDNTDLRLVVSKALSCVPQKVVDYLMEKCLIFSNWQSAAASYIPNKYIKGKHMIILSDEMLNGDETQTYELILHECAHSWLRHKSPLLGNLTVEEAERQEKDADALAQKWLRNLR